MHRVYNCAFMHMLRDEDNAGYRQVIRDTLEFDPAILGRFVNFLTNPDERTAVEQFGTGDKDFGVATLLATLPGLPMLGHGQVEGFGERYGMEFRRARWTSSRTTGCSARTSARSCRCSTAGRFAGLGRLPPVRRRRRRRRRRRGRVRLLERARRRAVARRLPQPARVDGPGGSGSWVPAKGQGPALVSGAGRGWAEVRRCARPALPRRGAPGSSTSAGRGGPRGGLSSGSAPTTAGSI